MVPKEKETFSYTFERDVTFLSAVSFVFRVYIGQSSEPNPTSPDSDAAKSMSAPAMTVGRSRGTNRGGPWMW